MTDSHSGSEILRPAEKSESASQRPASVSPERRRKKSPSMHEGIAVWCDCCSCEAEPYWVEIAKEMGMELGSDYEDADT
ncbi:MAG: hypothetical protein LJE70_14815 [Chromatiaceae bacterium]|jgi:hypothetical protein|nr:hypothetical protein [Chromatiaceae bacterium]